METDRSTVSYGAASSLGEGCRERQLSWLLDNTSTGLTPMGGWEEDSAAQAHVGSNGSSSSELGGYGCVSI